MPFTLSLSLTLPRCCCVQVNGRWIDLDATLHVPYSVGHVLVGTSSMSGGGAYKAGPTRRSLAWVHNTPGWPHLPASHSLTHHSLTHSLQMAALIGNLEIDLLGFSHEWRKGPSV